MGLLRRFAPHNDRLKKCAFTLAELMITIGIVGVVAAITIPLLIQNSNYKKFTTQFRKSLSTLNQAAISAQAQYDMDYGTLTSDSAPSTCATDSLSGGQSTMCALLNNTLAGKTYMGVYGEVAGSMILTKYQFTKKTDGFDPANFLIYSMADGSIVGFNPSMKNCSLSGELTKSVLTDSNKLANCIGFIDVNGVSLPNKEVTCSDGTSALEPNNPCTLKSKPWGLGDVFPVVFHNGTVEPATNAAKAFFSGESSSATDDISENEIDFSKWEPFEPSPMSKSDCEKNKEKYGISECYNGNDYWAGAMKYCQDQGKRLPTQEELDKLADELYTCDVETTSSGEVISSCSLKHLDTSKYPHLSGLGSSWYYLWSGSESSADGAGCRGFRSSDSSWNDHGRNSSYLRAVCVGDLK